MQDQLSVFREIFVYLVQLTAGLATTISACSVILDIAIWRGLVSRLVLVDSTVGLGFVFLVKVLVIA